MPLELRRGIFLSFSLSDTPHYENVPFEIPKGWVWTNIEELFFVTKLAGFEYTDYLTKDVISINNEVPIVRAQNVKMGHFIENTNEAISKVLSQQLERSALTKKCLLMTFIGAGIGDTCIFPASKRCHLAPNVAKIEPYSDKIDLKYVLYYLMSDLGQLGVRGISKSTAQPSLSMATIRCLEVALPPFGEQSYIVAEIEKWFALIDQIEQGKADLQTTIKHTKNKILDLAIRGKLIPQDPNDEPAIELLKRINPDFTPCDNGHDKKLPNGWCHCRISDVAVSLLGKTLDRSKNTGNLKKYLCAINVKWGAFELATIKEMQIEDTEFERYSVKSGDLMVCEGGDVGRAAIWTYNSEMYYQNALHRIRFKENISAHYFLYFLMYLKIKGIIDDACKGVTIKHLTQNAMNSLIFNLPPLAEQQRIVQKIEELFSVLDNIQKALEV